MRAVLRASARSRRRRIGCDRSSPRESPSLSLARGDLDPLKPDDEGRDLRCPRGPSEIMSSSAFVVTTAALGALAICATKNASAAAAALRQF